MSTELLTELYGMAKVLQQELDRVTRLIALARPPVEEVYTYNPCAPLDAHFDPVEPVSASEGMRTLDEGEIELPRDFNSPPVAIIPTVSPVESPAKVAQGFGKIEYR